MAISLELAAILNRTIGLTSHHIVGYNTDSAGAAAFAADTPAEFFLNLLKAFPTTLTASERAAIRDGLDASALKEITVIDVARIQDFETAGSLENPLEKIIIGRITVGFDVGSPVQSFRPGELWIVTARNTYVRLREAPSDPGRTDIKVIEADAASDITDVVGTAFPNSDIIFLKITGDFNLTFDGTAYTFVAGQLWINTSVPNWTLLTTAGGGSAAAGPVRVNYHTPDDATEFAAISTSAAGIHLMKPTSNFTVSGTTYVFGDIYIYETTNSEWINIRDDNYVRTVEVVSVGSASALDSIAGGDVPGPESPTIIKILADFEKTISGLRYVFSQDEVWISSGGIWINVFEASSGEDQQARDNAAAAGRTAAGADAKADANTARVQALENAQFAARLRIFPIAFPSSASIVGSHQMVIDQLREDLLFDGVSPAINGIRLVEVESDTVVHRQVWQYSGAEQNIEFDISQQEATAIGTTGATVTFRLYFDNANGEVDRSSDILCPVGPAQGYPTPRSDLISESASRAAADTALSTRITALEGSGGGGGTPLLLESDAQTGTTNLVRNTWVDIGTLTIPAGDAPGEIALFFEATATRTSGAGTISVRLRRGTDIIKAAAEETEISGAVEHKPIVVMATDTPGTAADAVYTVQARFTSNNLAANVGASQFIALGGTTAQGQTDIEVRDAIRAALDAYEPEFVTVEPAYVPKSIVGLQTPLSVVLHGISTTDRSGATKVFINIGGFSTEFAFNPATAADRVLDLTLSADDAQTIFGNLATGADHVFASVIFRNAANAAVGNSLHFNIRFGDNPTTALSQRVDTLSGRIDALSARNPTVLRGIPFNAALALDWDDVAGPMRSTTLTADTTISFSNVSAGDVLVLQVTQNATGAHGITWPVSVEWAGGSAEAPAQGANEVSIYTLLALSSTRVVATALLNVS